MMVPAMVFFLFLLQMHLTIKAVCFTLGAFELQEYMADLQFFQKTFNLLSERLKLTESLVMHPYMA